MGVCFDVLQFGSELVKSWRCGVRECTGRRAESVCLPALASYANSLSTIAVTDVLAFAKRRFFDSMMHIGELLRDSVDASFEFPSALSCVTRSSAHKTTVLVANQTQ